ncbi:MAG TPA: class I SAM-dependent methyltransferase [Holophagaceae bacterium]|jgi:ubiquinone/menaquinone biosynthesis C-methylase UbiE|nr:class I SAM-dependent methyltransferase [Holophagaceae bacterium]
MHTTEEVIQANIKLHTHLVDKYRDTEPHYRPENIRHVDGIMGSLRREAPGGTLLDVGCGMGFIIDIAKGHFTKIRGVDVTQAMIERVDCASSACDISVQLAQVEQLPFQQDSFDAASAYALLHHLTDLAPAFKEICRVLKPGGVFYSDLDPNYYFWEAFNSLPEKGPYSGFVQRELNAVKHKDDELEADFGVDPKLLATAETLKHEGGGFKEEDLRKMLLEAGFSDVSIRYFWFLGEASVIHGDQSACADALRAHLIQMLPLSRHLFKYVSVWARK